MIAQIRIWWLERSAREHVLLSAMLCLIGAMLIWLGVVRPIDRWMNVAQARHSAAIAELGAITAKAGALKTERTMARSRQDGDVTTQVRVAAESAGFTLARADPGDGGRVQIMIVSAKSPALFGWLQALEREGLFVERASLRTNSDATIGFDATIRARSR